MQLNAFVYKAKYQAPLAEREILDSSEVQVFQEQSVHPPRLHRLTESDNVGTSEE